MTTHHHGCFLLLWCLIQSWGLRPSLLWDAQHPISRCLREGALWQGQQTPLLTHPGPVGGAPFTASLWNHLILYQFLLSGPECRPQCPDFGPCGREPANLGLAYLGSLNFLAFNLWVLFESWRRERIKRERRGKKDVKCDIKNKVWWGRVKMLSFRIASNLSVINLK